MSMIAFGIFALFLLSTVSAVPRPCCKIYSAIIANNQYAPIRCTIIWKTFTSGPVPSPDVITIDSMQSKIVEEKSIDIGWIARAEIEKIQCGSLSISGPFEEAGFEVLWNFSVESDKIVSVGPSSPTS